MTDKIYTLGYTGRKPQEIKEIVERLDARLFDIRFSPRSRVPRWAKKNLIILVGEDRYQHLKALGNANYKAGGPIQFVDFEAGRAAIEASDKPVILMCGCKDYHTCHRSTAARQLEALGFETEEIGSGGQPRKLPPIITQLSFLI